MKGLRALEKKERRGAVSPGCSAQLRTGIGLLGHALVCRLAG